MTNRRGTLPSARASYGSYDTGAGPAVRPMVPGRPRPRRCGPGGPVPDPDRPPGRCSGRSSQPPAASLARCRWSGWRRSCARWRVTWPRRRAGSWCCWPSSMSAAAGRAGRRSCAAWLSWRCQMSSGTAREHVRVARALRDLPVIRGEFAAARLSYVKVRALTRIATPQTEGQLAVMAAPMTGNQLERFARAHRQCSRADDAAARPGASACPGARPGGSGGSGPVPRRGRRGDQRHHRADARLHRRAGLDAARPGRHGPGPGPPAPPPQRGAAQGRPRTRPRPVPLPRLRVPPGRPAPHPALGQRRPDQPGQPHQLVPAAPHGRPRPRLPHRRRPRRHLHLLPARRHRPAAEPAAAVPRRRTSATSTTRRSPRTRSSRRGPGSGWTWTTPSTPAWPTRKSAPIARPAATPATASRPATPASTNPSTSPTGSAPPSATAPPRHPTPTRLHTSP